MKTGIVLIFLLFIVGDLVQTQENEEYSAKAQNDGEKANPLKSQESEEKLKTLYKKMIARRREEHFLLMKNLAKNPNFEVRFQLIRVGLDKVYEIIQKNRDLLEKEDENKITEVKMTIIENTCLLMDFIVNFSFDKIIYTVFSKLNNEHYLGDFLWSMKFTEKYIDLLDELTTKEFNFVKNLKSAIMNEEQLPKYPYENSVEKFLPNHEKVEEYQKKKKERLKLRKGPTLIDKFEL